MRLCGPEELDEDSDPWEVPFGSIDVWWRGMKNGDLMLMLAHLLQQNPAWRTRPIRLLRVIGSEAGREEVLRNMAHIANTSRIQVDPVVIVSEDIAGTIQQTSQYAALVILGFEPPIPGKELVFYEVMERFAGNLPRVLMVYNAGGMLLES